MGLSDSLPMISFYSIHSSMPKLCKNSQLLLLFRLTSGTFSVAKQAVVGHRHWFQLNYMRRYKKEGPKCSVPFQSIRSKEIHENSKDVLGDTDEDTIHLNNGCNAQTLTQRTDSPRIHRTSSSHHALGGHAPVLSAQSSA